MKAGILGFQSLSEIESHVTCLFMGPLPAMKRVWEV
jgi:hypothetical protein